MSCVRQCSCKKEFDSASQKLLSFYVVCKQYLQVVDLILGLDFGRNTENNIFVILFHCPNFFLSDILCHFLVPNSFNPPFRHFPANYVSVIFPGTTTIPLALLNILQIHRKTRVLLWKLRNLKHLFSQNTFGGYFFTLNKVTLNTEQSNLHFGIGSEKKRKCKNQSIPSHSALFSISFY